MSVAAKSIRFGGDIADEDPDSATRNGRYPDSWRLHQTQPTTDYQAQRRGGRGKQAAATKDEDFIEKPVCCQYA